MENKRTIDELVEKINALTPSEKRAIQVKLKEPVNSATNTENKEVSLNNIGRISNEEADAMLQAVNESKYYNTIALPQLHDPLAIAGEQGRELPERFEPSHQDLDIIFGGFQSEKSAEELVEEIYNLRTVGEERAS